MSSENGFGIHRGLFFNAKAVRMGAYIFSVLAFLMSGIFVSTQYWLYKGYPRSPTFFTWECYSRLALFEFAYFVLCASFTWVADVAGVQTAVLILLFIPTLLVVGFGHWGVILLAHRSAKYRLRTQHMKKMPRTRRVPA